MKILITGSSGFIGSHLADYFTAKGAEVTGADIKSVDDTVVKFILINRNHQEFSGLFKNETYDFCINASGSASVPYSIENPAEDFRLNVANVNSLLHAIRQNNPSCKFINFSSAAVYGNPISLPVKESMSLSPLSPYGFHKMISEQICAEFSKLYNIRTASLRVFSAYGPGLRKQLFWDLYQKTKKATKIELFGTGNESRDFIFISDLCHAVECVMNNAPLKGEVINVSSGEEITIKTAVETFISEFDPSIAFEFTGQEKKGDPLNWRADVSLLNKFGFKPIQSFKGGIKKLTEWLRSEE